VIPRPPRSTPWVITSIVLHVVIGVVLLKTISMPSVLLELFSNRGQPVIVERIGFLALPRSGGPAVAAKAGGDNRPIVSKPAPEPPTPVIAAPTTEPTTLPAAPTPGAVEKPAGGYGEVIGGGGATVGIRPSYTDPRLWLPPGPVVSAPMRPMTRAESLQTLLADKIRMFTDSVATAHPAERAPGDWTVTDKNGNKWGVDQKYIRLGKFSIPTAVLGMLPLNVQANPVQLERQRTMNAMTREINDQAARYDRDQSFRAAVKALRERKDKERKEAAAKANATGGTPAPPKP